MKMREALIRNEFISVYKVLYLHGIKSLNIYNLQEPSTRFFFFFSPFVSSLSHMVIRTSWRALLCAPCDMK